jgi:hypothetical protein
MESPPSHLVDTLDPPHRSDPEPPRGTLAIVGLYGALFVMGWLLIFLFIYLGRGT